jgi:outer membrane protein
MMQRTPHNWRACLAWLAASLWGAAPALAAAPAQPDARIVVAVLTDGPAENDPLPVSLLLEQAGAVLGESSRVEMPERLRRHGGWTIPGINAALDALLADPEVDVVVAIGLISSNQTARRASLSKPVIAASVADPVLEGYPLADGRSGRRNFTYIADFLGLKPQLDSFLKMTGSRHLAAAVDELLLASMPELTQLARQLESELGVRITLVPAGVNAGGIIDALPTDVDAVFVTPLLRTPVVEQQQLARRLQQRRLPSMAMSRAQVEAGLLMANTGNKSDYQRIARRIALDIQRIHSGENAADLEVALVVQPRLVINMQTARDIGFSPPWDFLTDAEQLNAQAPVSEAPLGLLDAMQRALTAPTSQASQWSAAIARDDARGARANLLPQLNLSASATRIDADHASTLTRAEKTATRELSVSQMVYSDDAWAGYTISRRLAEAADATARATLLDTLQDSASAYLTLLQAQAVENVRRSNVELTRQNLETSRVREAVGLAERSDYLRWVAQLSRDRSSLLESEAQRRQAETELRRVLHLTDEEVLHVTDAGLADPLSFVGDARTRAFMDTPAKWAVFERYAVAAARQQAPELTRSDAQVAAQDRALTNAKRSFYLPDFALVGKHDDQLWRAGAGSQQIPGGPGEKSWSVMLQASIPVFDGGLRRADLSRARHEVKLANAQRDVTRDGVDARMRFATQRVGASYPAIELANSAAAAATENLRMVSDAYGRGIVSVTELVDAQEAALSAELSAAGAKYGFLIDFVDVLRAMGDFSVLLDPGSRSDWYEKVNQWFIQSGARASASQP